MSIRSPDDWSNLTELVCPVVRTEEEKGSIYTVHKVGVLAANPAQCLKVSTKGVWFEAGRYFFPTIDVEHGGERQLCKLPLPLSNWAIDTVALAHGGMLSFPMQIEFGVLEGRHYAEML